MAHLHENFEWDEAKAEANSRKHGVTFDEAASPLEDEEGDCFHFDVDDPSHSEGEDRYLTFASFPARRSLVLIISWMDRSTDDEQTPASSPPVEPTSRRQLAMSVKPESRIVRRRAGTVPPVTPKALDRLESIDQDSIDLSDIPDLSVADRLIRDESGRLPRRSLIRDAVASVMAERHLTTYALWKEARVYCPTISESAVGEFLRGKRQIGLDYAEALMSATGLTIVRSGGG